VEQQLEPEAPLRQPQGILQQRFLLQPHVVVEAAEAFRLEVQPDTSQWRTRPAIPQ
jgi:hypothetical protein